MASFLKMKIKKEDWNSGKDFRAVKKYALRYLGRLCLAGKSVQRILEIAHDSKISGHLGCPVVFTGCAEGS